MVTGRHVFDVLVRCGDWFFRVMLQLETEQQAKQTALTASQGLEAELSSLRKEAEEKSFELTEQL